VNALDLRRIAETFSRWPGAWIPALYLVLLLILSPLHKTFDEWGGVMQYFAGVEILQGNGYRGWASNFWPPLYSLLVALASKIVPGFEAGKLISIFSSCALLYVTYRLTLTLGFSRRTGHFAQLFLGLHPLYAYESLQAHNHMLDPFLFVLGVTAFLAGVDRPAFGRLFVAGAVCGLAALTRYTSYVLVFLPLVLLASLRLRDVARLAAGFWAGFSLVSLPWWYQNTMDNGFAFHSLNYLNVLIGVDPPAVAMNNLATLWHLYGRTDVDGIADVVSANPVYFVRHLYWNLQTSIAAISSGPLGLLVIPGLLAGVLTLTASRWMTMIGVLGSLVLLVSMAHVYDRYLLAGIVLVTPLTVGFLLLFLGALQDKYPLLVTFRLRGLVVAFLLVASVLLSAKALLEYRKHDSACCWLADAGRVGATLRASDENIANKVVMAVDPARAYYAGSRYLSPPFEYEGDLLGMVSYEGVSERFKRYAPKFPADLETLRADYLVYTAQPTSPTLLKDPAQFSFLLDPDSDRIPPNFELVYRSRDVVAYRIIWSVDD
jgi:hypothetical protein